MKKLIIILAAVSVLTVSGCASYGELQYKCAQGDAQACISKNNRDNAFGGAAMYMQQYQQQQMQAQQQQQMPVTTHCTESALGGSFTCTTF